MKVHYVSRTAHEADRKCARMRYWSTVALGSGVQPSTEAPELIFGSALHAGHESLWTGHGVDDAISAVEATENFEQLSFTHKFLVECLVRAYARVRLPGIQEAWEMICTETEVSLELGESAEQRIRLVFLAKPDLLLRHRQLGQTRYEELKSTKLLTKGYLESWNYAVQLFAGIRACKESLNLVIDDAVMRFFYKGQEAEDYLRSPFTSAWRKPVSVAEDGVGSWLYEPKRPTSWKGWERFNLPESGISPADWVAILPQEACEEQLAQTQPLMFSAQAVDDWLEQVRIRESEIADATIRLQENASLPEPLHEAKRLVKRQILNRHFPQTTSQCVPAIGLPCPYRGLCWNDNAAHDPLSHGYEKRVPHHDTERLALQAATDEDHDHDEKRAGLLPGSGH